MEVANMNFVEFVCIWMSTLTYDLRAFIDTWIQKKMLDQMSEHLYSVIIEN